MTLESSDSDLSDESLSEEFHENTTETMVNLPLSHEVNLGGHRATVSTIAIEPSGVRMATGSNDTTLKLWDFATMTNRLKYFASIEPLGAYPLRLAEFSPTGSSILVIGGSSRAKLLTRDGEDISETPQGDMYLVSMKNTKGHVASLLYGNWNPTRNDSFATSSTDGTIRLWTLSKKGSVEQGSILTLKAKDGKKNTCSSFRFANDGKRLFCACEDGSLKVYEPSSTQVRPVEEVGSAQKFRGTLGVATDLQLTRDDLTLVTRTTNGCLFMWDCRRLEEPLTVFDDLPNSSDMTSCVFSPNGEYICTTTSDNSKGGSSSVVFFSRASVSRCFDVAVSSRNGAAVAVCWSPALNQIFYGSTSGSVVGLYSPETSKKGLLLCVSTPEKREEGSIANIGAGEVFLPNALPMYQTEFLPNGLPMTEANKRNKIRKDPVLTKKPTVPSGPRPDLVGKTTLSSHFMQSHLKKAWADEDPREALLRYEQDAKSKPVFTGRAYQYQDKIILADKTAEQEQEEQWERLKKRKLPSNTS
ncbi:transducin family protein / WD-40 repeat family protein [Galdieria sulphuraria]|uniref:Transducin family protein / WD-40 repeat family protein n=1 Tax=Galdieria sulphuraria TaxID=130081 RepID=M2Y8F8_GALSU|nr:transducin family protein / WD-40 repeat family protein [Galdieria sulphuraria]EME32129.1 transducin family protein / WD-40 repeat family protein [Galdieria sulphuraria]|eukprot:XP_005708649.1 transducin family protein / WD-40 repeat family protein [Galdieria sulphuraria]